MANDGAFFPATCDCEYDNDLRPLQGCDTGRLLPLSALNHGLHAKSDPHNQTAVLRLLYKDFSLANSLHR